MTIKAKDKFERQLHNSQFEMGCVICGCHPELHHIHNRTKHWYTIPLCKHHHKDDTPLSDRPTHDVGGGKLYAIHDDRTDFRDTYGTEEALFAKMRLELIERCEWPDEVEAKFQDYLHGPYSNEWLKEAMRDE